MYDVEEEPVLRVQGAISTGPRALAVGRLSRESVFNFDGSGARAAVKIDLSPSPGWTGSGELSYW